MSFRKIHDLSTSGDLLFHKVQLSGKLPALTYLSRKGRYHVMVDNSLSPEAACDATLHECAHLVLHNDPGRYLIGLDRHHDREKEADLFAREHRHEYD